MTVRLFPLILAFTVAATGLRGDPPVKFPVVFFPPEPPVYGALIENRATPPRWRFNGRWLTPPDGLADFVGETFYPALSTRLYSGKLSQSLEARIGQYRARRNALVHALLDQCVLFHDATEDRRTPGFRAFAAEQATPLAALETEAEGLRRDLARNDLWTVVDWNTQRSWKLDSFPPHREWANQEAEFQVMRAAAYYEDGLLPAQRGLLRELAHDLAQRVRHGQRPTGDRREIDAMFFSPEATRLRLPPNLPPEALARIAAYNRQKSSLQNQLRAALHAHEGAPRSERAAALARLAEEQWPHLGNLETLADEIRADLAPHFVPTPPRQAPPIPGWLLEIINPYNEDRDTYFGEMQEAGRLAAAQVPRPARTDDTDEQLREERAYQADRHEAERAATAEFQRVHEARLADLQHRSDAIRRALETIARTTPDPKTGRPIDVDTLLRRHVTVSEEFARFGWTTTLYAHYRTAMLQAGLSPEQRRLLFRYALAGLAQPLPYGEPIPNRKAIYPLPR